MKKYQYFLILFAIVSILFSSCTKKEDASNGNTVTDIDGNVYKTVKIGTQTWMAENLRTTKYRDGSSIPNVSSNVAWAALTTGACCTYENTTDNAKITAYGRFYNAYAVFDTRKIAPLGWHVPTDAEWRILTSYLGGADVAGGKVKEAGTTHWASPNLGADNTSSFTALPGGMRDYLSGWDTKLSFFGYWWSCTSRSPGLISVSYLEYGNSKMLQTEAYNNFGLSIRLIKDDATAITKKDPVITWTNPADITAGTALSATQLNATTDVPGTLVYTPAIGTKPNAGASQDLKVVFTPTDANYYNTVSKTVKINVNVVPSSADFTYAATQYSIFSPVQFYNQSTGANLTYSWNFNGEGYSTLKDPSFTFPTRGVKTVTLTINSSAGVKTISKTFTIKLSKVTVTTVSYWPTNFVSYYSELTIGSSTVKKSNTLGPNDYYTECAWTYNSEINVYSGTFEYGSGGSTYLTLTVYNTTGTKVKVLDFYSGDLLVNTPAAISSTDNNCRVIFTYK